VISPTERAALVRRRRFRYVRLLVPVVSSYVDRLRDAALDGEVCRRIVVPVDPPSKGSEREHMAVIVKSPPPPTPTPPDADVGALIDALLGGAAEISAPPAESVGRAVCHTCPHERKQHSRFGCLEEGCTCAVTYMDL
jgi:hypothetical protein